MKPFANRGAEVRLFRQVVLGESPARILLIEGPSSMGKTKLMQQFRRTCPPEVGCVQIDLKTMDLGLPSFFDQVCHGLEAVSFGRFWQELRGFCSGSVNFAGAQFTGSSNQIEVALSVDEQTQRYRLVQLQKAFFEDLADSPQRLVLIMDTFQAAPSELQTWIGGALCQAVAEDRLPNVAVAIAGQTVPDSNNIIWEEICEHRRLKPIHEVAEWQKVAQDLGIEDDFQFIRGVVSVLKGNPKEICTFLMSLREES